MIVGLAIQSVMSPFNLAENVLVSAVLLKGGLVNLKEKRIFGEKLRDEITAEDEVVDGEGNTIVLKKEISSKANSSKETAAKSFEDVLLDTWDLGADADIKPVMSMLSKKNINHATSENGWTPIMIMSGLGAKSAIGAMRQMRALGANPEQLDKEGWNALHWVCGYMICLRGIFDYCHVLTPLSCSIDHKGCIPRKCRCSPGATVQR